MHHLEVKVPPSPAARAGKSRNWALLPHGTAGRSGVCSECQSLQHQGKPPQCTGSSVGTGAWTPAPATTYCSRDLCTEHMARAHRAGGQSLLDKSSLPLMCIFQFSLMSSSTGGSSAPQVGRAAGEASPSPPRGSSRRRRDGTKAFPEPRDARWDFPKRGSWGAHPTVLLGHHISSLLSFTAPLLSGFGFAGGCASPWTTARGAQAQALFGEWDGKVLVNAEVMLQGEKLRALRVTKQSGASGWTMQQNPSSQNGIVRNYFFLFSVQQMDPLFGESRERTKSSLCKNCFPP